MGTSTRHGLGQEAARKEQQLTTEPLCVGIDVSKAFWTLQSGLAVVLLRSGLFQRICLSVPGDETEGGVRLDVAGLRAARVPGAHTCSAAEIASNPAASPAETISASVGVQSLGTSLPVRRGDVHPELHRLSSLVLELMCDGRSIVP